MTTIEDETILQRLIWSPSGYDGHRVRVDAFSNRDLTKGRYISVNRMDLLEKKTIQGVADAQRKGDPLKVEFGILLQCGAVRGLQDTEGRQPFDVTPQPGKNLAHCGIENKSENYQKSYRNQLRALLVKAVQEVKELSKFNYSSQ